MLASRHYTSGKACFKVALYFTWREGVLEVREPSAWQEGSKARIAHPSSGQHRHHRKACSTDRQQLSQHAASRGAGLPKPSGEPLNIALPVR